MDNEKQVLQSLIDTAIKEFRKGPERNRFNPDANAKYFEEFVVDLDQIVEPMIADPDGHNEDVSKRYARYIRSVSYYGGKKKVIRFRWFMHGPQGRSEDRFPNAQKPRAGTGQSRVQGPRW